jgi:hypothetical protein
MPERKVLLRVTGDGQDGKRTLREIGAELLKLATQKAVAEVKVNATQAHAQIRELKGDLSGLSASAKVDLQIGAAEAKITALRERLTRLATLDATPKVDIRIGQTVAQIERLEALIAKLGTQRAEPEIDATATAALAKIAEVEAALKIVGARTVTARVKVEVDRKLSDLGNLRREVEHSVAGGIGARPIAALIPDISRVGAELGKLGAEGLTMGSRIAAGFADAGFQAAQFASKTAGSIGSSVATGLSGIAAALLIVVPLLALAAPFVLGLVGALFALVAVTASAAAGVGALGLALLAAFGPVGAVIAFVAFQISKVVEAQKKQEAATAAAKNALVSQQQAHANFAQAQANESTQRLAALQAERDAVNALAQAEEGTRNAALGVEGAELSLQHARADLKAFRDEQRAAGNSLTSKFTDVATRRQTGVDGPLKGGDDAAKTALDYRDKLYAVKTALQGVRNAEQSVKDAQLQRGKAQTQVAEFQAKGLRAFDGYESALQQTETATRSLTKATTTLVESERKRDEVLGSLSPTQSKFADALKGIGKVLTTALGPAADEVFSALADSLGDVSDLAGDREVQSGLRGIGSALGDVIRALSEPLRSQGAKDALVELAEGGADLTRVFGAGILPDILRLLLAIAHEALPDVKSGAHGLADSFHGFVDAETKGSRLRRQINFVVSALRSVGRLGKSAVGVLIELFPDASKSGQNLVDKVTSLLRRLRSVLKTAEGKESLRKFFADSVDTVRDLYHLMRAIVGVIRDVSAVVTPLAQTVGGIAQGDAKKTGKGIQGIIDGLPDPTVGIADKLDSFLRKFGFGADGGIATGPTIAGEAGAEALIPLRPDVLGRLGRAIAGFTPAASLGFASVPAASSGSGSNRAGARTVNVKIDAPAGHWPDMGHALAALDQRLNALGV